MGEASAFPPAKLVVGILLSPRISLPTGRGSELALALEARLGCIEELGPELEFRWSGFYDEEMGGRPRRTFFSFSRLVDPSKLADIKIWTNKLEGEFAVGGGRGVNLDPGLLSLTRFVLATTKDRPHRIPLSSGIYADLTLVFQGGDFRALPWTYPDWASEEYLVFLRALRSRLKIQLSC
jgi:hypothetical protein